ncbi:hypothetical protein IWT140_00124 [Secundilactobacillus pentosiphilus]|uniref:Extracellular protein n=1 Tax=Secundilactobacillus pentosiphilus TaxID=1714682 RepID=A0A1Z5IL97_9LACO|nr:hypothetical protein [Secundilactobacillus pentosiphilus]GAX02527.1 hypothetical protein IWT140_00124 [Secundilactobacillus pentosiphilus]
MKVRRILFSLVLSFLFVVLGLGASSSTASAHSRTIHAFPSYIRGYWHTRNETHGMHITKHTLKIDGGAKLTHPRYKRVPFASQDVSVYNTRKHHRVTINFVTLAGHELSYTYNSNNLNSVPWTLHYGW